MVENRGVDAQSMQLAQKQFVYYAKDLKNGNPFSSTADADAVARGRSYLAQFSGIERVYQFMLSQAGKGTVNFNRDVKDSAQAVLNGRDIPGGIYEGRISVHGGESAEGRSVLRRRTMGAMRRGWKCGRQQLPGRNDR